MLTRGLGWYTNTQKLTMKGFAMIRGKQGWQRYKAKSLMV